MFITTSFTNGTTLRHARLREDEEDRPQVRVLPVLEDVPHGEDGADAVERAVWG